MFQQHIDLQELTPEGPGSFSLIVDHLCSLNALGSGAQAAPSLHSARGGSLFLDGVSRLQSLPFPCFLRRAPDKRKVPAPTT